MWGGANTGLTEFLSDTRGVILTWANPDGTQKIESTGPLNKKRMETVDEEFTKSDPDG
jgi:arylsulfatase